MVTTPGSAFSFDTVAPAGPEAESVGLARQAMAADLITRGEGWERGSRSMLLQNDRIALEVVVDRGLDIAGARVQQIPVGWRSATDIVAPWYVENSGFGPHRSFFGGLLKTCGLDHIGGPRTEPVPEGEQRSGEYPMHGRISGTPARLEAYGVKQTEAGLEAFVEGLVTQVAVFDEHLTLYRRIAITYGSSVIRISDRVTNHGFRPSPLAVLYHVNIGWPILAPGVEIAAPTRLLRGQVDYSPIGEPRPDGESRTWLFDSASGREGRGFAGICNPHVDAARSAGLRLTWDPEALPTMVCWQMNRVAGNYVVALEPSTILPTSANGAPEFPVLQPGETKVMGVGIELLCGQAGENLLR